MRDWVRQHPKLAIALFVLAEGLLLTAVYVAFGGPLLDAVFQAAVNAVMSGVILFFIVAGMRKTAARLEANGQILAYVRYPDARPGSLSSIWNMGIATPHAEWIESQPAVYESLVPSGRPTKICVLEVFPERRLIRGSERNYIAGLGNQAMTIRTEQGRVEIAASPKALDELVDAFTRGPGS
ncbi:hypothetical protein D477_002723 [Arthrobacter crystallopoietes BAB-32]|uniref:Uncharacterized protein n=1 Tax=Arthrobacter crystallopoietes BAB-32 TaxID=1246476 RepID=N1UZA6_9MICC|nr:hypothetical protein [Arthrobacter crystallopoietes]EMY35726.1 hypothetical protein D477_002723 [Arthrobacter crystallopoietes BAB-32]